MSKTETEMREIARAYDSGMPIKELTKLFNVRASDARSIAISYGCKPRKKDHKRGGKMKLYCPTCNTENELDSRFCKFCGYKIESDKETLKKAIEKIRGLAASSNDGKLADAIMNFFGLNFKEWFETVSKIVREEDAQNRE